MLFFALFAVTSAKALLEVTADGNLIRDHNRDLDDVVRGSAARPYIPSFGTIEDTYCENYRDPLADEEYSALINGKVEELRDYQQSIVGKALDPTTRRRPVI